jgi:high affinity Mn2+ porin
MCANFWGRRLASQIVGSAGVLLWFVLAVHPRALAQAEQPEETATPAMFHHSDDTRWWVSAQTNFIFQAHGAFPAEYSGINSLHNYSETAVSRVVTLYLGYEINNNTEIIVAPEEAGGHGISEALGLAGATNLDVVRNPSLSKAPYIGRAVLSHTFGFSKERVKVERTPISLQTNKPVRRLEVHLGKFTMPDYFDQNAVGGDSHLQFMNWTIDNNGGWDYAADTRGYTAGVVLEYQDRNWAARFGEAMMPKVANGPHLDADLLRAHAENYEIELRPKLTQQGATTLRFLSYVNHANMGDYRAAVQEYLDGLASTPDVTQTRLQGTMKYGFGVNLEQDFAHGIRGYARWGWNEPHKELFAYTEVNETFTGGADVQGTLWRRKFDRVGAAFVSNGISRDHQNYLALGGVGFLLGDGALSYGRENIVEMYYTTHVWRGVYFSGDIQHIVNPGYNQARGPVTVPGMRIHLEL